MEGRLVDWSSAWLGLVGCNWRPLFQKPCSVGGQDDSLLIFPAIHNVCVCVCVCAPHTFRGKQLVTETLTISIGAVCVGSQGVSVMVSECSITLDHIISFIIQ